MDNEQTRPKQTCTSCQHANIYCTYCNAYERMIYPEYKELEGCEAYRKVVAKK